MRAIGALTFLAVVVYVKSIDQAPPGYIANKTDGKAYKIMYQAQNWTRAEDACKNEGAQLAVPKTEEEFLFIQKLVRGMYFHHITGTKYKLLVWLGINNLEDYRVWKNVEGDNINYSDFHKWATSEDGLSYSNDPKEPHCVGMDAINPGFRDYWCHLRQPYICEILVTPSNATL